MSTGNQFEKIAKRKEGMRLWACYWVLQASLTCGLPLSLRKAAPAAVDKKQFWLSVQCRILVLFSFWSNWWSRKDFVLLVGHETLACSTTSQHVDHHNRRQDSAQLPFFTSTHGCQHTRFSLNQLCLNSPALQAMIVRALIKTDDKNTIKISYSDDRMLNLPIFRGPFVIVVFFFLTQSTMEGAGWIQGLDEFDKNPSQVQPGCSWNTGATFCSHIVTVAEWSWMHLTH